MLLPPSPGSQRNTPAVSFGSARVIAARQAYFEAGETWEGVIDPAIYRSWSRCLAADREAREPVDFQPVGRARLSELLEANATLLGAAEAPLSDFARAVAGAGYAVLLTDRLGNALSVAGAIHRQGAPMRQALRQGVDLSELAIGTSAMSCALMEGRAVGVAGPEHFFRANEGFHCAAAPIIDPLGEVIGALDITRDTPLPDRGALMLVSQCAQAIEYALLQALPARLILALSWRPQATAQDALVLAFGEEGRLLAASDSARRFFQLSPRPSAGASWGMAFGDLFEADFEATTAALRGARASLPLRLHAGLTLWATSQGRSPAAANPGVSLPRRSAGRSERGPEASPLAIFGDPDMPGKLALGMRALENQLPVMIQGETGTGKDVLARTLHHGSRHSAGPLVAINCAAIPENLIESELFGHEEGAFTGARRGGNPGKVELAQGGTLFLDEIGDMPLSLQARLLRVLESREVTRLGGGTSRPVDFQLICATHQNLAQAVAAGRFRADLYYRINGFMVTLPPLRERSDLPELIEGLLREITPGGRGLAPETLACLTRHPWPGNVRELRHALLHAHALAPAGTPLTPAHLPPHLLTAHGEPGPLPSLPSLSAREESAIAEALAAAQGRVGEAARLLGISRATLYRRLQRRPRVDERSKLV